MNPLNGCIALITGASSGIGAEMARQLAPRARRLVLVARRGDRLEALKAELARPGLEIECHAVDLGSDAEMAGFLEHVHSKCADVDLLVNNAGIGDHGLFEDSEWSRTQAMLDVNIKALTRLSHAVVPALVKSGRGAILNVSSVVSYLPMPNLAVYAATKAYVNSFTEALRAELRGTGVVVSALCPGPVNTEFGSQAKRSDEADAAPAPEFLKVPVEQVAREGLARLERGRARTIPGFALSLMMFFAALVPICILRLFLGTSSRHADRK